MSLKLISSDKLYTEIKEIKSRQDRTDSDMFHYFSDMEIDRLWDLAGYLDKRTQRRQMREWEI